MEYSKEETVGNFDNVAKFTFKDLTLDQLNLIRFCCYKVETRAIHYFRIDKNTSALLDEYLSHRLGLLPIVRTDDDLSEWYTIDVKGPYDVTSSDFKAKEGFAEIPFVREFPLIRLNKDEVIKGEVKIMPGTSETHSKYKAFSTCFVSDYSEETKTGTITIKSFGIMDPSDIIDEAIIISKTCRETHKDPNIFFKLTFPDV